jgi:hypothetical protein
MSDAPRPTLMQALAVFIPGLIITMLSAGRATANFESTDTELSIVPIVMLCIGAVLFAIGGLMTLIVVVRPMFAPRPQDSPSDRRQP